MIAKLLSLSALSSLALAAPTATVDARAATTATYSGNPLSGVNMWANSFYASQVSAFAVPTLGANAAKVAKVPSFQWIDTRAKITVAQNTLKEIRAANAAGANPANAALLVVYDLPDRDCAAAASNGEYSIANGGVAKYKEYIDALVTLFKEYSDVRTILVIEPDSLANLVTNLNVPKCANAKSAYIECTQYAVSKLNLANIAMYMDAGHAGWLGWPANIGPAAELYASIYKNAGAPKALRGLVTNVSNYNAFSLASAPAYAESNPNYDEQKYINQLQPLIKSRGWDARFIVDQGRSGKQPTGQIQWGDWCNAVGTGFGTRPTTNTGNSVVDAIVWVKPGGESDGTSNTSASRYDHNCGKSDALKPAPEAGTWFQKYFEQLYNNANPSFK